MNPAIVVVGYNRLASFERLIKSVVNAFYPVNNIDLIISLDYSDKISKLESVAHGINWRYGKLSVLKQPQNLGLRNHVLSCGDLSLKYGAVIVLEDDLMVSPNYYDYVLQVLNHYGSMNDIASISLYSHSWNGYANYQFVPQRNEYDVYWGQIGISWGQCWLSNSWHDFRKWYHDKKNITRFNDNRLPSMIDMWNDSSWAKYYYHYMVEKNKYNIIPYVSLSTNFSEPGVHSSTRSSDFQVMLMDCRCKMYNLPNPKNAVRYDMFFERVLDKNTMVAGISGDKICFNLNGLRDCASDKEYIITTNLYEDVTPIDQWGLHLRPIEMNVLSNIDGNDIFLYRSSDLKGRDLRNYKKTSSRRTRYELYGTPRKRLIDFILEN